MARTARKQTDRILQVMEKKVNKIYSQAYGDISRDWISFMDSHAKKLDDAYVKLQDAIVSGDKKAIDEAKSVYERTARNITVNNKRYQGMVDETAAKITHVNEVALDYVNGNMPKIYTINYNDFANEKIAGYSFSIVNENAVRELATTDKLLLPAKKINVPKDIAWNKKKINSQMLQGILQGESIPEMAKRLRNVTDMDRSSAIRNARTMTTSAENKGKQDSYKKAQSDGVNMVRIWISTNDERTRAWHSDLSGVEVGVDEAWDNDFGEIMYPGDPSADPCNVYNCRCTMRVKIKGFAWNTKDTLTRNEEAAITQYKSFEGFVVNNILREKGLKGLNKEQLTMVENLDSALDKLPSYKGNVTRTFTADVGTDQYNDLVESIKNNRLNSRAYMSTTKGDELFDPDASIRMKIVDSKSGKDLSQYDNGENEVLFKRNTKLDVLEYHYDENGVLIVKAKERKKRK